MNSYAPHRRVDGAAIPYLESPLFIQPHCDDAVLSSFTLLKRSRDPLVVTCFAGVPDPSVPPTDSDRLTGITSPYQRMLFRRTEDRAALAALGASAVHLDFVERAHRQNQDETGIVEHLAESIRPFAHERSTIVCPLGIGGNPNHAQAAAAVFTLAREMGIDVLWCADYPYAAWFSWPSWVTLTQTNPLLQPDALWQPALAGVGHPHVCTVVELSDDLVREKLEVFSMYETQVAVVERGDLRAVSHPDHIRYEVFYSTI